MDNLKQYNEGVKALRESVRQYNIAMELLEPFYPKCTVETVYCAARLDDFANKMEAMIQGMTKR